MLGLCAPGWVSQSEQVLGDRSDKEVEKCRETNKTYHQEGWCIVIWEVWTEWIVTRHFPAEIGPLNKGSWTFHED